MRNALGAAMLLIAVNVMAGTVTSLDPATVRVQSGEYFLTANGTGLGDLLVFDGPAGHFELDINAVSPSGSVIGWIPQEIVNTSGTYSVVVKGGSGDSEPVIFKVLKPGRPQLKLHVYELLAVLAKSRLGTNILYEVSVTGGDPDTATIDCDPKSGSVFPLGSSSIRCVARDLDGGSDEATISVTVTDGTPPTLNLPKAFEVETDNQEGAVVKFDAWASDDIDGDLAVKCFPESGKLFVPGRTRVQCEALDKSFNPTFGNFDVMVRPRDTGKLAISVPENFKVRAQSKEGAIVDYEVKAFGSADPDPVVECTPASGTDFRMGENRVLCIATDDFDQRAENSFTVEVYDGDALRMKDVTSEATSPDGADVAFEKEAEDWTQEITCSHDSGSRFVLGATTVDCHSKDERGRKVKGSFTVTVADTIAPHIDGIRLIPGAADGEQTIAVKVEVDAIDAADAMPRCSVSGIEGDAARSTGDLLLSARPNTDLRLQVTCTDSAGNRATEGATLRAGTTGRHRTTSN